MLKNKDSSICKNCKYLESPKKINLFISWLFEYYEKPPKYLCTYTTKINPITGEEILGDCYEMNYGGDYKYYVKKN
jgi:hypothetical protein